MAQDVLRMAPVTGMEFLHPAQTWQLSTLCDVLNVRLDFNPATGSQSAMQHADRTRILTIPIHTDGKQYVLATC